MAENAFENISTQTYVDGDLVVRPGETVTDVKEDRAEQFRGLYSWQFRETSGSKDAKSEAEIRSQIRDYQRPVAPINASVAHVELEQSAETDGQIEVKASDTGLPLAEDQAKKASRSKK